MDPLGVGDAERHREVIERRARRCRERRDLGNARLVRQREQPGDFDANPRADQPELAEVLAEARDLGRCCAHHEPEQSFRARQRSLKGASTIAAKRNVLKRFERVDLLKKRGQWKETSKVVGLPKTKPDV